MKYFILIIILILFSKNVYSNNLFDSPFYKIEFISNNEMELKSNDGSTDEIYFESAGDKLFFQIVN